MKQIINKLSVFLVIFVMVFGFTMLSNVGRVSAAEDDGRCETADVNDTNDCNGICERGDEAGTADCDTFCDVGEQPGSPDCEGTCDPTNDDECSPDCDPFGQCAFEQGGPSLTKVDPRTLVGRIISVVITLLGTVAAIIVLIGGFKWMTAAGNDDKVGEAKKLMAAGLIGFVIVLAAYSITTFVVRNLQEAGR